MEKTTLTTFLAIILLMLGVGPIAAGTLYNSDWGYWSTTADSVNRATACNPVYSPNFVTWGNYVLYGYVTTSGFKRQWLVTSDSGNTWTFGQDAAADSTSSSACFTITSSGDTVAYWLSYENNTSEADRWTLRRFTGTTEANRDTILGVDDGDTASTLNSRAGVLRLPSDSMLIQYRDEAIGANGTIIAACGGNFSSSETYVKKAEASTSFQTGPSFNFPKQIAWWIGSLDDMYYADTTSSMTLATGSFFSRLVSTEPYNRATFRWLSGDSGMASIWFKTAALIKAYTFRLSGGSATKVDSFTIGNGTPYVQDSLDNFSPSLRLIKLRDLPVVYAVIRVAPRIANNDSLDLYWARFHKDSGQWSGWTKCKAAEDGMKMAFFQCVPEITRNNRAAVGWASWTDSASNGKPSLYKWTIPESLSTVVSILADSLHNDYSSESDSFRIRVEMPAAVIFDSTVLAWTINGSSPDSVAGSQRFAKAYKGTGATDTIFQTISLTESDTLIVSAWLKDNAMGYSNKKTDTITYSAISLGKNKARRVKVMLGSVEASERRAVACADLWRKEQ